MGGKHREMKTPNAKTERRMRLRLDVGGTVQGVGFRPFVYRLARQLGVTGWVANGPSGVVIEAESSPGMLDEFTREISRAPPPGAWVRSVRRHRLAVAQYRSFEIQPTLGRGRNEPGLLPDKALCGECRSELFDPENRRYRYPFIGCTICGPRYTVAARLPFDRAATTMSGFPMCAACLAEYETPDDRRFHAQLNCCAQCGPKTALWSADGTALAFGERAVGQTTAALLSGKIVAVKGIGGFHLMADATNPDAIAALRERKRRARKPFALMFPDLESIEDVCEVDAVARASLESAESPIVVLRRRFDGAAAFPGIAPGLAFIGAMLPYSPLHHLLVADVGRPVIATSGNRSGEPICADDGPALARLSGIADLFLVHDRPIARQMDDSIVRSACGRTMLLRRARGFAPGAIEHRALAPVLGVGAHLKCTVALGSRHGIAVSEYLGDLETAETRRRRERAVADILTQQSAEPAAIGVDLNPEYPSGRLGPTGAGPVIGVQHHYAHALACMADNQIEAPVLAVVWDGAGLGTDGKIWGGEFLCIRHDGYERYAHLREFALPGGDKAIAEPRRTALGIVWECFGGRAVEPWSGPCARAFSKTELRVLTTMLERGLHCPRTTSAGRLFDAVSALLGLCYRNDYEGEAAMALESAVGDDDCGRAYPFALTGGQPVIIDWRPVFEAIIGDIGRETPGHIASRFHTTLAEIVATLAQRAAIEQVALTGGCFQNACLLERTVRRLEQSGLSPYWHRRLPPNDGGIAAGQVVGAALVLSKAPTPGG